MLNLIKGGQCSCSKSVADAVVLPTVWLYKVERSLQVIWDNEWSIMSVTIYLLSTVLKQPYNDIASIGKISVLHGLC